MIFKKEKMIARLDKQGMAVRVTPEIIAIMDNLDGQEVFENCWNRRVKGEAVYGCNGKDGKYYDVAESDCE